MIDLPTELLRVLAEMQSGKWTGSLTIHMVQGEIRTYDQRRSGRIVLTRETARA